MSLPQLQTDQGIAPSPIEEAGESFTHAAWRRFRRHRLAMVSLALLVVIGLVAIFAPFIAPYDPNAIDFNAVAQGPSWHHLLGTDGIGRDVLSRLIFASRVSLTLGISAAIISSVVGTVLGAVAGFYGRWVDTLIMRFVDVMLSIPTLYLLLFAAVTFTIDLASLTLIIGLTSWMGTARLVRGQILSLREVDYVQAARAAGAKPRRLMFRYLVPNAIAPVIVAGTLAVGNAILAESALSFLGLGLQIPTASWGTMLSGFEDVIYTQPYMLIWPGMAIVITVLLVNLVGDGLRDALDPRSKLH
jgi:peptide/nickel transport system permease protein